MTINGKTPRNVDDAVGVIKQAGNQIKLVVMREEDIPDISIDSTGAGEIDPNWASDTVDIVRALKKIQWTNGVSITEWKHQNPLPPTKWIREHYEWCDHHPDAHPMDMSS